MKKIIILTLCLCVLTTSPFAQSEKMPTTSAISKRTVKNDFPNIFRPVGILFDKVFNRKRESVCNLSANVTALDISSAELPISCSDSDDECSNNSRLVKVSTTAVSAENVDLKYLYTVTGGEIIGQGAKVTWNLSEAKPGIYFITAAVDEGWGVLGTIQTKEITVK
jgi:hypothetical protein